MKEEGGRKRERNLSFGSFIVFLWVIISIKNTEDNDHSHYFHSSAPLPSTIPLFSLDANLWGNIFLITPLWLWIIKSTHSQLHTSSCESRI